MAYDQKGLAAVGYKFDRKGNILPSTSLRQDQNAWTEYNRNLNNQITQPITLANGTSAYPRTGQGLVTLDPTYKGLTTRDIAALNGSGAPMKLGTIVPGEKSSYVQNPTTGEWELPASGSDWTTDNTLDALGLGLGALGSWGNWRAGELNRDLEQQGLRQRAQEHADNLALARDRLGLNQEELGLAYAKTGRQYTPGLYKQG